MADNKQDKSSAKKAPHNDSAELFESLYRKQLEKFSGNRKKKSASKKDGTRGGVIKPKSPSQVQVASRRKAGPHTASEKRKAVRRDSASQVQVGKSGKVPPRSDASLKGAFEKNGALQVSNDTREELGPKEVERIGEAKGVATAFGGKLVQNLDKVKIALLCVMLVVALGFISNSLGLVDFGRLLGLSEPTEKGSLKTRFAKAPPAKKAAAGAAKSPQETTTPSAPEKATSQMRRRIVQKPPETTTPFANPGVARRPSKRILPPRPQVNTQSPAKRHVPAQEPVVTQEPTVASTSTPTRVVAKAPALPPPPKQESIVASRSPEPVVSTQHPNVPDQSAESSIIPQERPGTRTPVRPLESRQVPAIPKDLPETSAPKIQPSAVDAASGSAKPSQREVVLGKQEIPPEDSDLSYPYSVYLGSYKTHARAAKAISDYQRKGLSPRGVKVDLGEKGIWYRVFAGHFRTRENAEAFIREKGVADAEVMKTKQVVPRNAYSSTDDKPKKEASEKGGPLAEATALSYPYAIYLGSYRNLDHTKRAVSVYQERGLSPYWVKLDLGDKGIWFRLFSGYFQKREQANQFIEEKKIEGAESRHTKYANLIGVFASQKELEAEKIRLSKFEWCPYAIPGPNGQSRLYVGAFYQKARAQRQHAELASKGIHSQIVQR